MCDFKDILFWVVIATAAYFCYDAMLGDMIDSSPFWELPKCLSQS